MGGTPESKSGEGEIPLSSRQDVGARFFRWGQGVGLGKKERRVGVLLGLFLMSAG